MNRIHLCLMLVCVCFLVVPTSAQDRPTMGVMDVSFLPKIGDQAQREWYTSTVRGRAIEQAKDSVDIIEGSKLERLIQVNAKECNTSSCLAQFAKTLGVDYLLGTRVIRHGGTWSVTLSLASSRTSSMLSEKLADFASESALKKGLPGLVSQALAPLRKSSSSASLAPGAVGSVPLPELEAPLPPPPPGAKKVVVQFSSVPEGAAVTVDGKGLCSSPCSRSVLEGEHWVEMRHAKFRPVRQRQEVRENGQQVSMTLEPLLGRLELEAVDGKGNALIADVLVDGVKVGQTPFDDLVSLAGKIQIQRQGEVVIPVSVDLKEGKTVKARVRADGMVSIPAGCFEMGSNNGHDHEKLVHRVCLNAFSMDMTEVTQGAYRQVVGTNPSEFSSCGDNCPVEKVNWDEAKTYCARVGKRLPTEAEWEYAARAGTVTMWYWGNDENRAGEYAWYDGNSGKETHPVGQKQPNTWGLYDMAGNVWEWTSDWYGDYPSEEQRNPAGPASGSTRVGRGGGWRFDPTYLRSSTRHGITPDGRINALGFRCVVSGP